MEMRIGIDLVSLNEFELATKQNRRLISRLFSENERSLNLRQLAGNFALKECLIKTLPQDSEFRFVDFEILRDVNGKPFTKRHGKIKKELRSWNIEISLSNKANLILGELLRYR